MIYPVINAAIRPSRITGAIDSAGKVSGKDNQDYYTQWGRYGLASAMCSTAQYNRWKFLVNYNFYRGNQWINDEDLNGFLNDETGEFRNRLRFTQNIVRPAVRYYVGSTQRMTFESTATNVSPMVISQKDEELAKRLHFQSVAQRKPLLKGAIENNFKLGEDEEETQTIFENEYVDLDEMAINALCKEVAVQNNFKRLQSILARNKRLGGVSVVKNWLENGKQKFGWVDLPYFIYDVAAQEPDLSDGDFMGDMNLMRSSELFDRFPIVMKHKDWQVAIENYCSTNTLYNPNPVLSMYGTYGNISNKIPVYEIYFKDIETCWYGYVKDKNTGKRILVNFSEDNTEYKKSDVVKPETDAEKLFIYGDMYHPITQNSSTWMLKKYDEVVNYIIFVPKEFTGAGSTVGDIVLEYGRTPYDTGKFPYFVDTIDYMYGEFLNPLDDTISIQRMMNRCLSAAEAQINNSRGAGLIVDRQVIDAQDGEAGMQKKFNQSKTVIVDGKRYGGNIQNSILPYDMTAGRGVELLFNVKDQLLGAANYASGINDASMGMSETDRGAVGVNDANLQQGSIVNNDMFFGMQQQFEKVYECIADRGKRFYADQDSKLSIMVGDKLAGVLKLSKGSKLMDFRITMKASISDEASIQANNSFLLELLQAQVIDKKTFSNLYGRVTLADLPYYIRQAEIQSEKLQQNIMKAQQEKSEGDKQQAQQQQQEGLALMQHNEQRQDQSEDKAHLNRLQVAALKGKYGIVQKLIGSRNSKDKQKTPAIKNAVKLVPK